MILFDNRYHIRAIFVDDFERAVGIFVSFRNEQGKPFRVHSPVIEEVKEPTVYNGWPSPTIEIPVEAAQQLLDDLWALGLRPKQDQGTPGVLAAKESHLADLRRYLDMLMKKHIGDR